MLLALDTSFGKFSIGIYSDDKQIAYFESDEYSKQAEMLVPEIENLLASANLQYADLTKIACCVGPGSFTGLRIGIAAVKGFELALGVEVIGISSLQASAVAQNGGKIYLDAKRGQAFFQEFDSNLKPLCNAELMEYDGKFSELPNADLVAKAALKPYTSNLEPIYIRKPDAKLPTKNS